MLVPSSGLPGPPASSSAEGVGWLADCHEACPTLSCWHCKRTKMKFEINMHDIYMTYTWYKYTSHVELELFKMTDIINTHIVG